MKNGERPVLDLHVEQSPPRKPPGGGKDGIIPRMPMSLNIRPLEVDRENPYANDALDRERDCLMLEDLIGKTGGPFTLAVDAEWGDGKTVFIRMLEVHLAKQDFRCVSFNAWECDFCDEPLAPLITEIGRQASESSSTLKEMKARGNKLYGCFKKIVSAVHPVAGAVVESAEELAVGEEAGGYDFMTPYEEYRSALESFRECLENFSRKEGNGKPLVVFIDEIDRCRPDFAVKTLERVKHIFNVPSLVFVMAVNRRELASVVKSFYGCEDGEKYLEKFFDLVFHLRNEKTLVGASLAEVGIGRFLDRMRSSQAGRLHDEATHVEWLAGYLESLSETFGFSLRVQQKLARTLCVALTTANYRFTSGEPFSPPEGFHVYWQIAFRYPLLCYFLALRIANPDLFRRSVECPSHEAFPWEEHFDSYLREMGVKKEGDSLLMGWLEPLLPVDRSPESDHLSVLQIVRPDESVLVCFSLLALADSWRDKSKKNFMDSLPRDITQPSLSGVVEAVGKVYRVTMKDYDSFREFLRAVDLAGKFYQRES